MGQVNIFTKHAQKANEWLKQIGEHAGCIDNKKSLAVLRVTLHHIRNNIPVEAVLHFSAQLPLIIRGLLFENWHLSEFPMKERKAEQFLKGIENELNFIDLDVNIWTGAVFYVLSLHISKGEIEKIKKVLPDDIKKIWDEFT